MRAPALIVVPALGVAPGYYRPLVDELQASLGVHAGVLALPRPRSLAEGLFGSARFGYDRIVHSIRDEAVRVRGAAAGQPVFLLGHSIGGQAGLLAAAQDPTLFDGVALVASGTPYWRAWPETERREIRSGLRVIDWVSRVLPWYPGQWVGFGGSQPRRLMRDWVSTARTGMYDGLAGGARYEALLEAARVNVLALRIEGDPYAPESAVEFLLNKLRCARIDRAVAASANLAAQPPVRRHTAWVREPSAVVPRIGRWMQSIAELRF